MAEWRVRWSGAARRDLLAIAQFIADENPTVAVDVIERLHVRAESIGRFPQRGRPLAGYVAHGKREYRELIEVPWRILYWIEAHEVQIVAVVDGRRDVIKWLNDSRRLPRGLK